jgi:hypothetical protein
MIAKPKFNIPRIGQANTIEEILCLSTLVAVKYLKWNATIEDSKVFQKTTTCGNCAFNNICLACIINE